MKPEPITAIAQTSLERLQRYCEKEDFRGWDPYDGLNSRLFQSLPLLKHSAICRLVMIQGMKRSPLNLRRIAFVPKQHNAKGIGLFLSGYCLEAKRTGSTHVIKQINYLADLLLSLRSEGYSGACWGYNFDWQARRLFLFPKGTPTVVATYFCASALLDAYEVTGREDLRDVALTSAEFILRDLHRTEAPGGFLFSYSPLKGNDTVYNASLLGSALLARIYSYTGQRELLEAAEASVSACCQGQRPDGAWVYGLLPVQKWVDSFHTGYNLMALHQFAKYSGIDSYSSYIDKGFDYYITHFFEADGTPKYYDNATYPIDIHCPGQLFVTLNVLGRFNEYASMSDAVLRWTIDHMQDRRGYFYYQIKPTLSSKISYMRWSNAFMFNALNHFLQND